MRLKWKKRFRLWFAWRFQRFAWYLYDSYDAWMIDYRNTEGHACCCVRTCGYRMARVAARELNGEIVGHSVVTIPARDDGEEFSC